MADEIRITLSVTVERGSYKATFPYSDALDQAATGAAGGVQSIGTSEENLSAGDLANVGYLFMRNLDSTNYVDWGVSDAGAMKAVGRLKAGDVAVLRVKPAAAVRMQANTAACLVQYLWLEA